MRLIFVTVPRITKQINKFHSNLTDFSGYFFTRKCCVWGANHSQPGDWWDTLLEQELGQGSFFCNITSPQPWSHHSRLSEHTAGQVCVHSASFCLDSSPFFSPCGVFHVILDHMSFLKCAEVTQHKAKLVLIHLTIVVTFPHYPHDTLLGGESHLHTQLFLNSFWTWLPHMLIATNQNITDWIKMIPWKKKLAFTLQLCTLEGTFERGHYCETGNLKRRNVWK